MPEVVRAVVVIGAGFSGTMVAAHLLRFSREPLRVVLVESRGVIGRGLAYSTAQRRHVLNVPCEKMGARPDDLPGFHRWVSARFPGASEGAFVSRGLYGQYIESELNDASSAGAPSVELQIVHEAAVDLRFEGNGVCVELEDRRSLRADHVVLAIGSGPSRVPLPLQKVARESERVVSRPFAPGALDEVGADDRVLILGTGLTMYDTVIALRDQGHRGPVLAVSRRGRTPFAHAPAPSPAWAPEWAASLASMASVRAVVREVREACGRGEREGFGWRGVIDSMRSHLPAIWRSWGIDERVRFLKQIAPFWDVLRHRCAPEVAAEIEALRARGVLRVERGRMRSFRVDGHEVVAEFGAPGEAGSRAERVDRLLVCAGPEPDVTRWPDPLMKSLLAQGLVWPDPLRLGVRTDGPGRVLDRDGNPVHRLSMVGPLRKADLWEHTAVPELRTGAQEAGADVLERVFGGERAGVATNL